ncbi:DNA polymerase-3 subunit epsilon [Calidifontibacter indicus]|uniref:DNA polymerase-3 subunit epsilon n=2 Tax=Calidifontibacter indicus TaxID=419650 RepID=A0A3D9UMN8_9MICO|nr:DNA polymerase-3 subunit epsilon [Calidifontibacter indicus]
MLPNGVANTYDRPYALVDVETTGLTASRDRVVQIAIAQMEPNGVVTDQWSTLIDPERDPGPVEIHGITRARLRGAPRYADVAPRIHEMLSRRVVVAHNARFDWDFLAHEAHRAGHRFPADTRLCTCQLSQRFDLPVADFRLASLCDYWGIKQHRAHDAEDDVRALVELTRHSLALAHRLGLPLPYARPRPLGGYPPVAPRTPCMWRYPGRHVPGQPLRQGMTVVFTGQTHRDRAMLIETATRCGLDVMNSVSSRTSVLVSNGELGTRKGDLALKHGTSLMTEEQFMGLLDSVEPGDPRTMAQVVVQTMPDAVPVLSPPRPRAKVAAPGRFSRRRVIILGGSHDEAADVRTRVQEVGGTCAVNLTVTVTDFVALADAEKDARISKVKDRALTELDPVTLEPVGASQPSANDEAQQLDSVDVVSLPRGGVTDIAHLDFTVIATWVAAEAVGEVDVVAFVSDPTGSVARDEDFCFYNQPTHPTGLVDLDLATPDQASVDVRAGTLPIDSRITLAAAIDGDGTFGDLGAIELSVRSSEGSLLARATLDAAADETSMLLAEVYWRSGALRFRAIGQGYQRRLAGLAVGYGVDIEEDVE